MVLDAVLDGGEVIVLDGAVGSEIARLGGAMDAAAWCGVANVTHADVVRAVHEGYLRAGADVITANTFATCRHVLAGAGRGDEAPGITRRAVALAREAVRRVAPQRKVAVAGSMSNTLAWIPGTVNADPRFVPTAAEEAANYREMADALAEAGADLILLEMMLDVEHAVRLAQAASATGLPLWVGISCTLRPDGELVAWDMYAEEPAARLVPGQERPPPAELDAVIDALAAFNPQAMGIMHSSVQATGAGLAALRRRWAGPVMAYPEALEGHAVTPRAFAAHCLAWIGQGVQIVGGCCGTTIAHIRALTDALGKQPV